MTRKIFFRAKSIEDDTKGQWIYGFYREFKTNKGINYFIDSCDNNESFFIDNTTVGQYTGLNDCNGKKIFEGDRCRITRTCILANGFIKFKYGSFYFKENCAETLINLSDLEFNNYKIEVTGTIFEKENQND